jgi:hypothetical protein
MPHHRRGILLEGNLNNNNYYEPHHRMMIIVFMRDVKVGVNAMAKLILARLTKQGETYVS